MNAAASSPSTHREANELCLRAGILLLQHGAESALVESVARRTGLAMGLDRVDVAIMANAVTVSTIQGDELVTNVRRNEDQGINMHVIVEVQRIMLDAEARKLDLRAAVHALDQLHPFRYPRWIVVVVIGFSCACFARLAHADLAGCAVTFAASALAMAVRQRLAHLHFSPLINFAVAAFVATSVAAQGLIHQWTATPKVAMAASCLLLVPGVPLINSVSDMVKGYINTGISRWAFATLLTVATCAGIILAMTVWRVWAWL
jgi:uncharacterized membrane protein YjjP (DUF1212 family)